MIFLRLVFFCGIFASLAVAESTEFPEFENALGFQFEESTLADVQREFGDADQFEVSEGHHEFGICYWVVDSPAIVMFLSNAEFGGPDKLLLGVAIHDTNSESLPCATSTLESSELVVGELRLGLTAEGFQSLSVDDVRRLDDGYFDLDLEYKRPLTNIEQERLRKQGFGEDMPDGIYVGLGIWCRIVDDSATEIGVWHVSTF
ncbi:MAG: hypothetical protein K0U72_13660 [Gammaproteobacteria bacterium]|nr:hypothetical protein [Gammaproteobacteria bacterium]